MFGKSSNIQEITKIDKRNKDTNLRWLLKSLKSRPVKRHTWHYQDDSFLLLYDTLVKKNPLSKNKKKVVRNEGEFREI